MDKKRKDSVIRATVDRAALLRGVLMLTALALLLCFGLKPSRAAAPDAENGALTASDASARLSAECELLQRVTFSPCGHEMTRRQRLPAELAGMTKDELAAKYDQWVITSFSPAQVSMERALALYCPEHVVLMPDESGQLCIFRNRYGDALALVRELGVPLSDLPDDVQEEVRPGLGFDDEVTLEKWLTRKKLALPTVNDPSGQLARQWDIQVTPTLVVISQGEVKSVTTGWTSGWGMRLRLWLASW